MLTKFLVLVALTTACAEAHQDGLDAGIDAGPPSCSPSNDTCTGESLCINNRCEPAFPRVFVLTGLRVTVPNAQPNGDDWDAFGGAPDLYLARSNLAPLTAFVPNRFTAAFTETIEIQLVASGVAVSIVVLDDDYPADPDEAFVCTNVVYAASVKAHTFGCSGALGALSAVLSVR